MTLSRWLATFASVLMCTVAGSASASEVSEITKDTYEKVFEFRRIVEEYPEVGKQKSERRQIAMVARDRGWRRKALAAALEKVRGLDGDLADVAGAALEEAFASTPRTKGKIVKASFDLSSPQNAVLYVRWRASKRREVNEEAATIAALVKDAVPFVSTLSIAAIHPSAPEDTEKTVWEGVISRSSMEHISLRRVDTYADRRYACRQASGGGRCGMFTDHKSIPF
jgi:hypothetical protein